MILLSQYISLRTIKVGSDDCGSIPLARHGWYGLLRCQSDVGGTLCERLSATCDNGTAERAAYQKDEADVFLRRRLGGGRQDLSP
jgi:hypothetical protein